jgi:hypothetical protein
MYLLRKVEDAQMTNSARLKVEKEYTPGDILRKVPRRPKNTMVRSREYLTMEDVEALMKAASSTGRRL